MALSVLGEMILKLKINILSDLVNWYHLELILLSLDRFSDNSLKSKITCNIVILFAARRLASCVMIGDLF